MSGPVKRYAIHHCSQDSYERTMMEERLGGAYVEARAYDALAAELANLRKKLRITKTITDGFLEERDTLTEANRKLRLFGNSMVDIAFEGSDAYGSDIQELAWENGLLIQEEVSESCGDNCSCAQYGFPANCYRRAEFLKGPRHD